jgi:hypothetical protein
VDTRKRAPWLGPRSESQGEATIRFASFHRMSLLMLIGSRLGNNESLAWQDGSSYTRLDDIPDLTCNSSKARVLGSGGRAADQGIRMGESLSPVGGRVWHSGGPALRSTRLH